MRVPPRAGKVRGLSGGRLQGAHAALRTNRVPGQRVQGTPMARPRSFQDAQVRGMYNPEFARAGMIRFSISLHKLI